jgi:hypothetical protein
LLEQCGINYWAVPFDLLPEPDTLRAEFLGANNMPREIALEPPASQFQEMEGVRQRLHETLDRNRAHRPHSTPGSLESQILASRPFDAETDHGFAATQPFDTSSLPSSFPSNMPSNFANSMPSHFEHSVPANFAHSVPSHPVNGLHQPNSFLSSLQSRRAGLDRV